MELHFTRTNGPVDNEIDRLIELAGGICCPDIVREMVLAAIKAGQEAGEADLKLMNSTVKEMRFTSKVFGNYRGIQKVSIFGSARTRPEERIYDMAHLLGLKLAEAGYMVITGGGPGIMQAATEGAGMEHSFAVNIRLPFEQASAAAEGNPRRIIYKYFFNRKVAFLKEACAIVLFPGGFGTLDEAMESLTLLQTGKHDPVPVILVDEATGTYWEECLQFFRKELMSRFYIGEFDLDLIERVDNPDAAVEIIRRFYRRYHSLRYADKHLVIRVKSPLQESQIEELRKDFHDILTPNGGIRISGPFPVEADEPEIADLQRVVVDFNRKDFARLRCLINRINSF